ncbi:carboxypeptidase B-like [Styela clava]
MKLFVLFSLVSLALAKKTFFGDQVLTLYPTTQDQVELIRGYEDEIDFWNPGYPSQVHENSPVDVRIEKFQLMKFKRTMKDAGINFEVKIGDVQMAIDEQVEPRSNHPKALIGYNYDVYHTYDQINSWTMDMEQQYPTLVTRSVIGTSWEGRDIPMLTLKTSDSKPAMLVDCGFHAREWISPAFCQCYVQQLIDSEILNDLTIHVIPVVNVDGYEYTHTTDRMWRKTRSKRAGSICYGVDPNRNCDAGWSGPGSSSKPCSETYYGPEKESEPEVKAVADFIRANINSLKAYVTFHAYGQMILYPYSYTEGVAATKDNLDYYAVAAYNAVKTPYNTNYIYGPGATTIYLAAGGSDDFAYDAGVPLSYTIELRDEGRYGFALPERQIEPVCIETFNLMEVMHQGARDRANGIILE